MSACRCFFSFNDTGEHRDKRKKFSWNKNARSIVFLCFITVTAMYFVYLKYDLKPSLTFGRYTISRENRSGLGYMLAVRFSDQGTGSFVNLLSFMCFASEVGGVGVVEPFMVGSILGKNVSASWKDEVQFRDIFDKNLVQRFAQSKHFRGLVSYDEFLEDAPRRLLVAQYKCESSFCIPCGHEKALEKGRIFSELNGFELVGQVCLDYGPRGVLTRKEVEEMLYANYSKSEVVVMFILFGGLETGTYSVHYAYRFFVSPSSCYRKHFRRKSLIRPSQLAVNSANKYSHVFLGGKQYISVMVRMQMILRSNVREKEAPQLTEKCLRNLYDKIGEIRARYRIETVFLCLDVGRYGSDIFRDESIMNPLLPIFNSFLSWTIKDGMTLSEWDDTFGNVSAKQDPGFIALMQKVIAAKGDVLVTLGAESTFQATTRELYKSLHKKGKVIVLDKSCR